MNGLGHYGAFKHYSTLSDYIFIPALTLVQLSAQLGAFYSITTSGIASVNYTRSQINTSYIYIALQG